ncbi:MAG: hypothetical protein GJ677_09820 [Rhodobacteraceae bacterium]|nr:hypothetical protein [Paracoccaceae bacterium]
MLRVVVITSIILAWLPQNPVLAQASSQVLRLAENVCFDDTVDDELAVLCAVWMTNNQILSALGEIQSNQGYALHGIRGAAENTVEIKNILQRSQ